MHRMERAFKKLWAWLQGYKVAVGLFMFLTLYWVLATLLAASQEDLNNVRGLYAIIESMRPQLKFFGLENPYSSVWFILPVIALFFSTVACALTRTRVAQQRVKAYRHLCDLNPDELSRRGVRVSEVFEESILSGGALKEFGLRRDSLQVENDSAVYSKQRWALFSSPLFHWSLVAMMLVVFLGVLSRAESMMTIAETQTLPIVDENVVYTMKGPLYGTTQKPFIVRVAGSEANLVVDGIEHGFTPKVELLDSTGQVLKSQYVYPNAPLSHANLMIHRIETYGMAAHFVMTAEDGYTEPFIEILELSEDEETQLILPLTFELLNDQYEGGGVSVTFMLLPPSHDSEGNVIPVKLSQAEGIIVVRQLESREIILDDNMNVGDTIQIFDDLALTLERVTYTTTLKIVDDWSVKPLYALLLIATLLAAGALMTNPAVAIVGRGSDGASYAFLRLYRPSSFSARDVYDHLRAAGEDGRSWDIPPDTVGEER